MNVTQIVTKIKVVLRDQIVATEFNQLKGVAKIKELTHEWKPDFIYVDAGFGTTQVELLKEYGLRHPETKLHNIVKPIDMGSKTELKDPVTGEVLKKHTKHLMRAQSQQMAQVGTYEDRPLPCRHRHTLAPLCYVKDRTQ